MTHSYVQSNTATSMWSRCIEYAQLLSTAHRVLDGEEYTVIQNGRRLKRWETPNQMYDKGLMLASHINHPSNKWVRESHKNYLWLCNLLHCLLKEYTHRYGKFHAVGRRVNTLMHPPQNIPMDKHLCHNVCLMIVR